MNRVVLQYRRAQINRAKSVEEIRKRSPILRPIWVHNGAPTRRRAVPAYGWVRAVGAASITVPVLGRQAPISVHRRVSFNDALNLWLNWGTPCGK